ncbi:MAG: acetate/propionate family kinase [Ruminococcaceae bacterium]|nr:acetate/propionate family kinase [Oscillospiraceae bacterium]
MACNILVLNIGSTSFKFKYFNMEDESVIAKGKIGSVFTDKSDFEFLAKNFKEKGFLDTKDGYKICLEKVISLIDENCEGGRKNVGAIGFKTVMAGEINYPCVLDDDVIDKMKDLSLVAPAHNTPYIEAYKIVKNLFPNIKIVGSFETAFHNTIPSYATMYPIDKDLAQKYGIRKYGFHGAAHSYVAHKLSDKHEKIISVHLGGSSSVCAIKNGKSVDTSMGFSPQSGVAMNNRCGDVDIFSILYLMEKENMNAEDMRKFLSTKCGLLGMSKISNDMRDIENGNDKTVLDAYTYSVAKYISSYLATLGGVDAISFSGGIGENSIRIKKDILKRLEFLGLELDDEKLENTENTGTFEISKDTSKVKIYITYVDEELMVAKNTYKLLERR